MPDRITLICGSAPWLDRFCGALPVLAAITLLASDTDFAWKLVTLLALTISWQIMRRHWASHQQPYSLALKREGTEIVAESTGSRRIVRPGSAWVSRWLCAFRLETSATAPGKTCIICSSANHPDDYRRLMTWFRLGVSSEQRDYIW